MTALVQSPQLIGFDDLVGAAAKSWPPGLSIRARQPADIEALAELFMQRDFQRNASTLDPFEQPDDARAVLERSGPGVFDMVAVLDRGDNSADLVAARIVGFAGLYVFAGRQRHVGCCTLAVHEGFQQRGIGSALLQALMRTAYDYVGLERLQLSVFADNTRALSLYRRAGFGIEGRLRSFARREDGLIDAILLAHHPDAEDDRPGDVKGLI